MTADELLVTGDFRHAAKQGKEQEDIDAVVGYIKEIAASVGIHDVKHIHLVPGNHDRDRDQKDVDFLSNIRNTYDPQKGRFENTQLDFLLSKFEYFNMVCSTLYGSDNPWRENVLHTYQVVGNTVFLYMNTAIMHNDDTDRKESRLIIGNDLFDQLLTTINTDYPDYPIIILAHHSPDMFIKSEKEAVEDIISKHKNVILYLCGDSHEAWPRYINSYLEITMGCIKQEEGAEETFLYGDTSSHEYKVFHWENAWEPYCAYTEKIKTISKLKPITLSVTPSSKNTFSLNIFVNPNEKICDETEFERQVLVWMDYGKKADSVKINLQFLGLAELDEKHKMLDQKLKTSRLDKKEKYEYASYNDQIEILNARKTRKEKACELFLTNKFVHNTYAFNPDEIEYILSSIIEYDTDINYINLCNDDNYFIVDFILNREKDNQFYFSVPIKKESLVEHDITEENYYAKIQGLDISYFDRTTVMGGFEKISVNLI